MTREEYERTYGIKPVFSSQSILEDEKPAPIRMTRAEYEGLYGELPKKEPGLGSDLLGRGRDILSAIGGNPIRAPLRVAGAVTGAGNDVIGAILSPAVQKTVEGISETGTTQKIATSPPVSKGLDIANKGVETVKGLWGSFETAHPELAQDLRDLTNILSFATVSKPVGKIKVPTAIEETLAERGVKNVVNEIAKIEGKYTKTRNANNYSKDIQASRQRIAQSNVLDGAVDTDGVIRTKTPGGAIDQYKAQTIDGAEDIVRRVLKETKETIPMADVRRALVREVGASGLEGADLVTALKKIDKEIEGLNTRIKGSSIIDVTALKKIDNEIEGLNTRIKGSSIIDLTYLHDAKIATTRNINYMTPPEKATYRKAIARAYKTLVEEGSKKFDVKEVNSRLARYYDDIARLERLDGARAEGGRLGKATASIVGTAIGMGAGSVGGGFGAALGGIAGGEAAQALKGLGMSRTFKGGGKGLLPDEVLAKARLRVPDKVVRVPSTIKKTKEMERLESDIQKNVAQQKKAIAKGDFALVQALKQVYEALVEQLTQIVKKVKEEVKESIENPGLGLSIKRSVSPETALEKLSLSEIDTIKQYITNPANKDIPGKIQDILEKIEINKATDPVQVDFLKEVVREYDIKLDEQINRTASEAEK